MTTAETRALDAVAVTALAKVNKLARKSQRLLNAIFALLLVTAITFSALAYVKITSLIVAQNKRSASNQELLQTIKADDKILKTATGPGTVAASTKQVNCIINRLDHDTSLVMTHTIPLDPTCPKFTTMPPAK